MEAHNTAMSKAPQENEETKKMHHDLHSLMDKYEEMANKIGTSSLVDQLLTSTNFPYS